MKCTWRSHIESDTLGSIISTSAFVFLVLALWLWGLGTCKISIWNSHIDSTLNLLRVLHRFLFFFLTLRVNKATVVLSTQQQKVKLLLRFIVALIVTVKDRRIEKRTCGSIYATTAVL